MSIFSLHGRARRTFYCVFVLITVAAYFAISMTFFAWLVKTDQNHIIETMRRADPNTAHTFDIFTRIPISLIYGGMVVCAILVLGLYVAWIIVSVRRLHDMNVTGWLILICMVVALFPCAGYILVSMVLGFWPGSSGRNRFGVDPRVPFEIAGVFEGRVMSGASPSLR